MKLKDLKHRIDFIYEQYKNRPEIPDNLDVVITTSERSIGGRAKVDVSAVHRGIDWEHNQFRIEPTCKLIKLSEVENDGRKYFLSDYVLYYRDSNSYKYS